MYNFLTILGSNMTGAEFKAIRTANFITQEDLAVQLNRSLSRIRQVEALDYIPAKYIKALSDLLGVDLFNEAKLEMVKNGIPERYKKERRGKKNMYLHPSLW